MSSKEAFCNEGDKIARALGKIPREERRGDADVGGERLVDVVEVALRIGGGQDGAAGLQLAHEARLGHADGLLLHGLVDAGPVQNRCPSHEISREMVSNCQLSQLTKAV